MTLLTKIGHSIGEILKSRILGGLPGLVILIGTIYAVSSWVISTDSRLEKLEESALSLQESDSSKVEQSEVPESDSQSTTEPNVTSLHAFSTKGHVRCPGGGDWLGRERNYRADKVEFEVRDGAWILTDPPYQPRVEVLADNDGSYGTIAFPERDSERRPTKVSVPFACNPPNTLGSGGGWMTIRLRGYYQRPQ